MLAHVTPLRRKGVRLTKADVGSAETFYGDLSVKALRASELARRAVRIAELTPISLREKKSGRVLPPLFDPVLVYMNGSTLMLMGFEVQNLYDARGSVVEYVQGWLVRSADADDDHALL
jgi:hypothetical protein